MRRDKKDYSEREREHRSDHLLLVFERFLVFLEKPSGSSLLASESSAVGLPTLHLPLPVINLSAADGPSSAKDLKSPPTGETRRVTKLLSPIVQLSGVLKVTSDARGEFLLSFTSLWLFLLMFCFYFTH